MNRTRTLLKIACYMRSAAKIVIIPTALDNTKYSVNILSKEELEEYGVYTIVTPGVLRLKLDSGDIVNEDNARLILKFA